MAVDPSTPRVRKASNTRRESWVYQLRSQMFSKSSLHVVNGVRTNGQQRREGGRAVIETVKTALTRQKETLWQDALGALSIAVILVGALHLPSLV